jgi:hypothetical protein
MSALSISAFYFLLCAFRSHRPCVPVSLSPYVRPVHFYFLLSTFCFRV